MSISQILPVSGLSDPSSDTGTYPRRRTTWRLWILLCALGCNSFAQAAERLVVTDQNMFLIGESAKLLDTGLPIPQVVRDHCSAPQESGVLGSLLVGFLGKWFVASTKTWVDNKIASYSATHTTPVRHESFYEPSRWARDEEEGDTSFSCLLIAQQICMAAAGATSCPEGHPARLIVVAQYQRTAEAIRVRPLYARVMDLSPLSYKNGRPASLAVRVKLEAVWVKDKVGYAAPVFDAPLLAKKFVASKIAVELPIKVKEWAFLPAYPLPARSDTPDAEGMIATVVTVAEAAEVPNSLKAFKAFLDTSGGDLSSALTDALKTLL